MGWFWQERRAPLLMGRTAADWSALHGRPTHRRDDDWSERLASAVREITGAADGGPPLHVANVLISDASEAARCVAAIQLSVDCSPESERALIASLQDESELVRRTAAKSLVMLGTVAGLAAVVRGSGHGKGVRTAAAFKLAKMKPGEAIEALPSLMMLMRYPHIDTRAHFAALSALQTIGDAAIPVLVNALHRGPDFVRMTAAIGLKEMGRTPELLPLINTELRKGGVACSGEDQAK